MVYKFQVINEKNEEIEYFGSEIMRFMKLNYKFNLTSKAANKRWGPASFSTTTEDITLYELYELGIRLKFYMHHCQDVMVDNVKAFNGYITPANDGLPSHETKVVGVNKKGYIVRINDADMLITYDQMKQIYEEFDKSQIRINGAKCR